MLKIAFYFNNRNTLGHSIKVFSLVKKLKNHFHNNINIFVIETGFTETNIFPFSDYAISIFYPIFYNKISVNKSIENNFISFGKALINFKPDIFITEYFPFTNKPDFFWLAYLVEYIKKNFHTKIVCSCTHLNRTNHAYNLIKKIYDVILFHFPEDFSFKHRHLFKRGAIQTDEILNEFKEKIFFTGFLLDYNSPNLSLSSEYIRRNLGLNKEKLIVVSRGGCNEYDQLTPLLLRIAKRNKDYFFLISTGLSKKSKEFINLFNLTKGMDNIRLSTLIYPHFDDFLNACDLSINMAGYNTMVRLLYFNKRSIVIPVPDTDQPRNANLLSRFIPSKIINKKELKVSFLDAKIKQVMSMKNIVGEVKAEWFEGLDKSVRIINKVS